jgi:6-phosphofructokinase
MLRCLLATLGKDAPGVNASIRAATRLALERGLEVYGAKRGFPGILERQFHKLKQTEVGFILGKGGSLLGSVDFRLPLEAPEAIGKLSQSLRQFDLVVASGGLGSFSILNQVYAQTDMGLTTTMFIPASVENEFLNPLPPGPDREIHAESVGADTAANTAIQAIDRLREQSYLSRTVFVIQTIGLKSNYLPVEIGISCGAHRIYLPEHPPLEPEAVAEIRELFGGSFHPHRLDVKELVAWIERMFEESQRSFLVVVIPSGIQMVEEVIRARGAEEPRPEPYERVVRSMAPAEFTVLRLVDDLLMHFSRDASVQVRYVVLDDLQRGGAPTLRDRVLGSLYGEAAIEEFLSVYNSQDTSRRGNLNLLALEEITSAAWRCHPRQSVAPLFFGPSSRAGGLDPLPFFRQSRGTVSGYRPLAGI